MALTSASYGEDKGTLAAMISGAGALQGMQAPRLRSAAGSYAAWKFDMEVHLERMRREVNSLL